MTTLPNKEIYRAPIPLIGIDLGGTKIEGIVLAPAPKAQLGELPASGAAALPVSAALTAFRSSRDDWQIWSRRRIGAPRENYDNTISAIKELVETLDHDIAHHASAAASGNLGSHKRHSTTAKTPIGIGMPGSIAPQSKLVQNANSTWLNGRPFERDLATALGRDVRCANDANCFALSEAVDGAGAGARTVFGVILGTGCGGAIVHGGKLLDGPRAIAGEWGHNPLPWPDSESALSDHSTPAPAVSASVNPYRANPDEQFSEHPGPLCWCGRHGCMETWVSGPALSADHAHAAGETLSAQQIAAHAAGALGADGSVQVSALQRAQAQHTLARHASRLARGLATVVNLVDPEVIVLGGGLSQLAHLYRDVPKLMAPYIFAQDKSIDIRPPKWGDSSGVRGAAWLWNDSSI